MTAYLNISRASPEAPEEKIYTVTELNTSSKILLESKFSGIVLDGEISNFKKYSSGHLYFSLKDSHSQISAVMYSFKAAGLNFKPEDGMQVRVRGTVTVYPVRGSYQILTDKMAQKGMGELRKKFEELKEKLKAEGLFAQERKRALPALPQKIGVVTSPTGAAIRDILTVLARRFSNVHLLLYPVAVQGSSAKGEIVAAIQDLNAHFEDIDVIIVGRGGGSLEDLWAFNEEEVARAIFASRIPIISAVGHEIDWMISDFVADKRAATPSVAAEIVLGRKSEMMKRIGISVKRISAALDNGFQRLETRLDSVILRPYFREPKLFLANFEQNFDRTFEDLGSVKEKMFRKYDDSMEKNISRLKILSPLGTLSRGYAIASFPDGRILKEAGDVSAGENINVVLRKGKLDCEVKASAPE